MENQTKKKLDWKLETESQVRKAWSQVTLPKNAKLHQAKELAVLKKRILAAGKKLGIEFNQASEVPHAIALIDNLAQETISPLLQSVKNGQEQLLQSHYYVEDSYEERMDEVRAAFNKWTTTLEGDMRYCYILAVFDTYVIACNGWSGNCYCKVPYREVSDEIVFDETNITEVGVKMVVETLGIEDEETQAMPENEQTPVTQKDVKNEVVKVLHEDQPSQFSDANPKLSDEETEANTKGVSVPDVTVGEPTRNNAPNEDNQDYSDDIATTPGDTEGESTSVVTKAMNKTAAGYKQTEEVPHTAEFLLQGVTTDLSGEPMSFAKLVQKAADKDGKSHMVLEGIATRGDIINTQGQVYPLSVWEKNLERMNQEAAAGKFIGKLEHPDLDQGLVDTAIKWDKFEIKGNDVWFQATVVKTEPHGKNLEALIDAGVQVDFSTRGYGTVKQSDWRGKIRPVVQDDFVCTGIDAVWKGASSGSTLKSVNYQSQGATETVPDTTPTVEERANAILQEARLAETKTALLNKAELNDLGLKAYQTALDKASDLTTLLQVSDSILPTLQTTFPKVVEDAKAIVQSSTYMPTFFVKQTQEEQAPKTVGEMFDRLVEGLPDDTVPGVPTPFVSQKQACKKLMVNIAKEQQGAFNGRSAALGLLALEQGKIDRAQDILTQSLATGSTVATGNADGDGAPLSAPMIFPLIRRVFPRYIMNEIASIQPMDRPQGKMFYLDAYRTEDPAGTDKRIDLNTSASPFNSSYADNATEGAAAQLIRLKLASVTIDASTKKLGAAWSIEEMQDLRAYHGLDASVELLGSVAREMALEWNQVVLDDMMAQATAGALTFGTGAATGFTQDKWDEYIWNYIQKLDNLIFSTRNGAMTHLICGMDAALALAKSMRGTFSIASDSGGDMGEVYPGTTYFGVLTVPTGSRYKVFKTNFWRMGSTNGGRILGLRKGTEWSDTPYVYAPYTDFVTPMLTDPADFSQKQGIVSRAGKKVVVANAMGYITVNSSTGALL